MSLTRTEEQKNERTGRTAEQAFEAIANAKAPRLADLLFNIAKEISLPEVAKIIADNIRNGSPATKAKFAEAFLSLMKVHEKAQGEITEDDVSKLTDEMLDLCFEKDFGVTPKDKQ